MIPFLWRLLGLRYLWRFLFGSWLVRCVWGEQKRKRPQHNGEDSDAEQD